MKEKKACCAEDDLKMIKMMIKTMIKMMIKMMIEMMIMMMMIWTRLVQKMICEAMGTAEDLVVAGVNSQFGQQVVQTYRGTVDDLVF